MNELLAGIDIGGSSAKIGLVRPDTGEIVARCKVAGPRGGGVAGDAAGAAVLVERYCTAVEELLQDVSAPHAAAPRRQAAPDPGAPRPETARLAGVGIGLPGYITEGGLPELTNVPMLDGYPVTRHVAARLGVRVAMDNDANVALLGEYSYGAGRGSRRLVLVTGGSGIGIAARLDGEMMLFTGHSTGNMGHIIVDPTSEQRCFIGCRGCLETMATAGALQRRALEAARRHPDSPLGRRLTAAGEVTPADVKAAVDDGDPIAAAALKETGWWFGVGLASFAHIFVPDRILIGGGLSELGRPFHDGALEGLSHVGMPYCLDRLQVQPAALGNDAGIVGAVAALWMALSSSPRNRSR